MFVVAVSLHMSPSLAFSYGSFLCHSLPWKELFTPAQHKEKGGKVLVGFTIGFFGKVGGGCFFKTLMENFNTEAFHPGNGAFAKKQKKGEGSLKEQLNLAFQLHCIKKP